MQNPPSLTLAPAAQPDQRFEHVVSLIRMGTFGWADFFEPIVDSITSGGDYYLLANDFPSYIEAQVQDYTFISACLCTKTTLRPVLLTAE